MAVGTIVRFDELKGYGFIAPDGGGEDVFVHGNDFGDQRRLVQPGLPVEYEPTAGERGQKALFARLLATEPARGAGSAAAVESPSRLGDDECEVLTAEAFTSSVTELLIENVPTLTGLQIGQVRRHLLTFARSNGWIDN